MKTMFDIIKKQNGEHFAKAIRAYDNGIFDIPNLDKIVKYAGREAEPLMNYLVSLKDVKIEEHAVHQHPFDLLSRAGYTAYYADTLEKQNWPKQFYAPGEELCTFHDPERYKNYHIIVAIKKNVQDIKRENFSNPQREDEYGTSVLQIQMLKSGGFISIKNRYNHMVENPDNTFNSNPDNIIPGLSDALMHHYHVDFSSQNVQLPENYVLIDNQIVKYNYEVNNVYFGENCYVKNGEVHEIDKQKELMLDYFILNLQDKSIKNPSGINDGFIAALQEEIKDKKLQITVNQQGNKCLQADGKTILELDHGKIKSLHFDNVKKIDDNFLWNNKELSEISLSQITNIGYNFLYRNAGLEQISLPEVRTIGKAFIFSNNIIKKVDLPKVTDIGKHFLAYNNNLIEIALPEVKNIDHSFLVENKNLSNISLPKVENIGDDFLRENKQLKNLSLPQLRTIDYNFLYNNESLSYIYLPKVEKIGNNFLHENKKLKNLSLPQIRAIGYDFLSKNASLSQISLPKVKKIGSFFLLSNNTLAEIWFPEVEYIGNNFLSKNKKLQRIYLPNIESVGDSFLENHPNKDKLWENRDKPFTKDNNNFKIMQDIKSNHRE